MKKPLFILICFLPLITFSQARNQIKPLDIHYDFLLTNKTFDDAKIFVSNRFVGSAGYSRLIGNRISVGINYQKFISFGKRNYYDFTGIYNNYDFEENGSGFGYDTKYYFSDHDNEGANSGYVGFSLNRISFTQEYTNIDYSTKSSFTKSYHVTRYGVKIGYQVSDILLQDFSCGLYFNDVSSPEHYMSLTSVTTVTFVISYGIGLAL